MMDPIFRDVAEERPDIVFGKVNVDEEPKLAQRHEIRAIPRLLVLVDGKVVKTGVGVMNKEALLKLLDEAVKKQSNPNSLRVFTGLKQVVDQLGNICLVLY
jgi:thioredoxin-like negative regulator of GroEL